MNAPPSAPRRVDESMTLLTEILERPLDPAYGALARRRVAAGLPASRGSRSALFVVTLVVLGSVIGTGASTLRGSATARAEARSELIRQIDAARSTHDGRAARVAALTAEVSARDAQILAAESGEDASRLRELALVTGSATVTGPGLVVTLDNAPDTNAAGNNSDPRNSARSQDGVVRARDLQIVANSLWMAGAEAIMINGQRLTATSAIRFAGEAILVNYRPLVPPYAVTAIGDPASLPPRFAQGPGGTYVSTLKGSFGIRVETRTNESVTLPGLAGIQTRVAHPPAGSASPPAVPAPAPASSSTPAASPSASSGDRK